jgi:hypothetical protein
LKIRAVRHHDLGDHQAARRGHEGGGEQVFGSNAELGVGGKHRPRHTGHPDGHERENLGIRES